MDKRTMTRAGAMLALLVAGAAHAQDRVGLGEVNDRVYAMNRASLAPIDGGFSFGVFTDKKEGAAADTLANGKPYRSSFLGVEVRCAQQQYRIARARFFAEGQARGAVVAEDELPADTGWIAAQTGTIGATFVNAACPGAK